MNMNKLRDSIFISCCAIVVINLAPAAAQEPAPLDSATATASTSALPTQSNNDKPIEITAGQTLEWHRNDNKYIARGQVEARQGDTAIYSETLTADYRSTDKSANEIYQLTAEQDVRVQNTTTTIYGQKAVYDVDKAYAVMTGDNLKMVSPDQTVTARDRMEYWSNTGEALAIGNAKVVRAEDTLNADTVKAIFKETPTGREIDTLHALGHVVIVTPNETLTGDRGIYHSANNTAEIFGNVRIVRGQNELEGDRAEVDLTTNISKIFGGPTASAGAGDGAYAVFSIPAATRVRMQPHRLRSKPWPRPAAHKRALRLRHCLRRPRRYLWYLHPPPPSNRPRFSPPPLDKDNNIMTAAELINWGLLITVFWWR
jgi:lipopolysaccharide export system protein LptA